MSFSRGDTKPFNTSFSSIICLSLLDSWKDLTTCLASPKSVMLAPSVATFHNWRYILSARPVPALPDRWTVVYWRSDWWPSGSDFHVGYNCFGALHSAGRTDFRLWIFANGSLSSATDACFGWCRANEVRSWRVMCAHDNWDLALFLFIYCKLFD